MAWFEKVRATVDLLRSLRRPALPLTLAHARYDPMVLALADALTEEFGVTWSVSREAELDRDGRRWEYTTQMMNTSERLDEFPDWSTRYETVVNSVAQVSPPGTIGYHPKPTSDQDRDHVAASVWQHEGEEMVLVPVDDLGPTRTTRDAVGGNIELDIDGDGTHLYASVAITPTSR